MAKGHIRQRGPSAWEIKYDAGTDPLTGRRITKYKTIRGTKRDAQREMRVAISAVESGTYADPGKLTTGDWLTRWLDEVQHSIGARTLQRYREIVTLHLIPGLGHIPLAKLAAIHIQQHFGTALASGRRDGAGGLSAQTVTHHGRVLNVALKRARSIRLISGNPVEDVSRPKVTRPEIEVLNAEQASALLAAARTTRMYPIIVLALGTGLRRGEILGLRWSDLDLDAGRLTVNQALEQTKGGLAFKQPKTKRSRRTIALPVSVIEVVRAHRAQQAADRLGLGMGRDPAGLVFTRIDGDPIQPDSVTKMFARIATRAGVGGVSFHGLRHTHATDLLRAGVHPKVASERLGHATIAITLDTYSHVIPGLQEDAVQRIDGALRNAISGTKGGNPVANDGAVASIKTAKD